MRLCSVVMPTNIWARDRTRTRARELASARVLYTIASHCQLDDSVGDFSSASEGSIFLHV